MLASEYVQNAISRFKTAGLETPALDAELLISHAIGIDRFKLISDGALLEAAEYEESIEAFIRRRLHREPVAYITNTKEFYSLSFYVDRRVLIPRPETELLVDLAIYYAPMQGTLLDLGTGSGAIAIAVKHSRADLQIIATDISSDALDVAKQNARSIFGNENIEFCMGDLFDAVAGRQFHCIVSNPPYVNKSDKDSLQRELLFEPEGALFADDNGHCVIARIIKEAKDYLLERGVLLVEIGETMKDFVKSQGEESGFSTSLLNDYAGLPRVAVLKKKIC